MPQNESIDTPYFLTKQTANLQEDFVREIKNSASLFLLYGEEGVGKTRLLEELVSTRLNGWRIHWVDCKKRVDEANEAIELGSVFERTLDIATIGDVIVADHFELATNKMKHQLLQSWATDGVDKKFCLIIATGEAGLEEVRDAATRYRLNVKSFQLLPLTHGEIDDYCASRLFSSFPPSPLSMTKQTRWAFNETRGVIGKVRDVVEQHRNNIARQGPSSSPSIVKLLSVVFGLTIMLLVGRAYQLIPVALVEPLLLSPLPLSQQGEDIVELAQPTDNLAASVPVVEVDGPLTPSILEPKEMIQSPVIGESVVLEPLVEVGIVDEDVVEIGEVEISEVEISEVEVDIASKDESVKGTAVKGTAVKAEDLVDIAGKWPYSDWFKTELKRSRDWFETTEGSRATIQVMSIKLDSETDDAYLSYVDMLQKNGVDTSQLHVHPKRVREKAVLGIFFGDYDSWQVARKSIFDLPSALGSTQPFPRSLGGFSSEDSQL
ncbi:MAG: hypothetical protein ACI8XX_002253 [Polaribacter sp.]|jgi:hypothetical protein